MRILLDLNVLLDVVQRREPFYGMSAILVSKVANAEMTGCLPSHAITTLYYVVNRSAGRERADELVDWLLAHFEIVPQDRSQFLRARSLGFQDFEDAAVASAAEVARCDVIATRNVADFEKSPIPALTPEEFLARLPS